MAGRGGAKRRDLVRGTLSSELELPETADLAVTVGAVASCPKETVVPKRSPTDWLSGIGTAPRKEKMKVSRMRNAKIKTRENSYLTSLPRPETLGRQGLGGL